MALISGVALARRVGENLQHASPDYCARWCRLGADTNGCGGEHERAGDSLSYARGGYSRSGRWGARFAGPCWFRVAP